MAEAAGRGLCVAALWMSALFFALEHPILTGGAVPMWDARDLHAPTQMLLADHARAGRLLGWNPWTQAGSPDFADPQSGAFSPVSVGLGALTGGGTLAFALLWLSHWLLGGVGMLVLAARLGAPAWGALIAALGWLFSGLYTAQAQHVPIGISFSWLPWVLWRVDVAVRERRVLPAAQAGALWGLSALSGYPAMTIVNPAVAALWAATRWGGGGARFGARAALAFALVGGVVLAPAYVAILVEAPGYSDETRPKPREVALRSDALAPGALATLSSPSLPALKVRNPSIWPQTDASVSSLYCGAVATCLALFALARPERLRIALAALAALALALAVGDATPLRGWLYDLVPPSRYFRHAALFRVYAMLALVLLAACGALDLARAAAARDTEAWRRFTLVAGLATLAALLAHGAVVRRADTLPPDLGLARWHMATAWVGTTLVALFAPALERVRRGLAALALVLVASADAAGAHLLSPMLYTTSPRLVTAWSAIDERRSDALVLESGLARRLEMPFAGEPSGLNVAQRIATLRGYHSLRNRFHERWLAEPVLALAALELPGERSRIWFAADAVETAPSDAAWQHFARAASRSRALPLVVHPREAMLDPESATAALDGSTALPIAEPIAVRLARYATDELRFDVTCPSAGWLLVTDRWARSWRASVNDADAPVFGANFLFRAVRVHAGENRVRFTYEPRGYGALVAASWSALAIVALASAAAAWRQEPRG